MNQTTLPPHHRLAEKLARRARQRDRFRQSLLIYGPVGAGHAEVATRFGQAVFCDSGEGPFGACGKCRNCQRVERKTHPDWIWMEPDRSGRGLPNISIEALRDLQDRLVLEPYEGPKVVACVYEAEKMRPEAANSLLKLVEEPPRNSLFILVTENRQRILPTIQSRCLPAPLAPPEPRIIAEQLILEGSDPKEAEQIARWALSEGVSPEEAASQHAREFRQECLDILRLSIEGGEGDFVPHLKSLRFDRDTMLRALRELRGYLQEILLLSSGGSGPLVHTSHGEALRLWANSSDPVKLMEALDQSFEFEEGLLGYANPAHTMIVFLGLIRKAFET